MDEKLLEDIGLTKGEVKVYLTLLKIGETTTGKIIEEAQISSGKIYEILDKLASKGLVSYVVKEKTKYFNAASPNRILDFLNEKGKLLKDKEEKLREELPSLFELQKAKRKKHETNLFVGLKGIRTAIFEALDDLSKEDEVLVMGVRSSKNEKYNIMWQSWHAKRMKKKIVCRAIFSDKGTEYYKSFKKMTYIKVKVLDGLTPSAIDIIGNRVLIFTYEGESSCLSILNEEISKSFKTFFETLWKISK